MAITMAALTERLGALGLGAPPPEIPAADLLVRPLDIYRAHLASLLAQALDCDPDLAFQAISATSNDSLGDFAITLHRLRPNGDITKEFVTEVCMKLPASPLFTAPVPDHPRIRYYFAAKTLPQLLLPFIEERGSQYGRHESQGLRDPADAASGRKKVVVEFSSPNVGTEFDGNHLRSTIIGAFAANMYECMGWDVVRLNFLGDWGMKLSLLCLGWLRFGSEDSLQADPLGHMLELHSRMMELFKPEVDAQKLAKTEKRSTAEIEGSGIFAERDGFLRKLEDGDEEALALLKRFRDLTIKQISPAYERLGVRFDEYSGESQARPGTMTGVESVLKDKGFYEQEDDGAWVLDFGKHGEKDGKGLGKATVRSRTGSTTYLLRDIGAAIDREETYSFDKMIYVVSSRQSTHFKDVFLALKMADRSALRDKLEHIGFGEIQGMSTHLNDVHLLGSIVDRATELIRTAKRQDQGEDVDEEAISAIGDSEAVSLLLLQDMSSRRAQGYTFDPRRILSNEGDSGLLLQDTYQGLASLVATVTAQETAAAEIDYASLTDDASIEILSIMAQYPDVTATAAKSLEPHGLLSHLHRLAEAIDGTLPGDDDDDGDGDGGAGPSERPGETPGAFGARISLYKCALQVLENGMKLLGFPVATVSAN